MHEHASRFTCEVVEFCPSTASPVTMDAVIVPLVPKAPQVSPWRRPPLRYRDYLATIRAWREIYRLISATRPDVVLAHPCRYAAAPPVLRWLAIPSVYFCHEPRRVDFEHEGAMTRNRVTALPYWPLHRTERRADRAAVARVSAVVTNSAFSADRILRAYGRSAKPIPLGVSSQFVPLAEPADPLHILSVGALTRVKGHDLVIRAAALARIRWPVVIVTPREDLEEAGRLGRTASESGVNLKICVAISDDELVALYQRAFATLYLALAEPFGLASIEAQACGSPVVIANEGGLPETVVDGSTGWRVPRSPTAAAKCLDLLGDASVRRRMARRASTHGRSFSWERSTRAMEAALDVARRSTKV